MSVALVSGGSRGIGKAIVLRLAGEGFDVAFCYRSDERSALELAEIAAKAGGRVVATKVDVTDATSVRAWVGGVERELGPVDVAVTSAGITADAPLALMADESWHRVLDTNLSGVYHVCRSVVVGMMKRRSGSVVTLSSVSGVYGNAAQTNYSASKAGIIGFTRALAKEAGRYGVRANVVAPGLIETGMTQALKEPARKKALAAIPLGRFGTPEEVAGLVSYLASPQASYVTGSVLEIHGGLAI
ncbi:3-oxoacyl-ACP reductase FabG [Nonomuraea sp. B12E4]|uniref:3-oxoacyl-ACP reductase FabG n=1 Tax=Nonomuraea sp. B12E4 TaxID=3153564 RepID=UPI00325F62D1